MMNKNLFLYFWPASLFVVSTALSTKSVTALKTVGNEKVPGLTNGMDYVKLGDSDLVVSKVCMGTVSNGMNRLRNCGRG